ncbi:unnamed protein product [Ranitomeya imitator]|uniref:Uncharacterized protein n=1 Tax=Ranitomeya imitator TaxID=111125 RepID=A0ABN9LMD9_9NEOB|nr:unnamed protein product [Ranitomeya imitator]
MLLHPKASASPTPQLHIVQLPQLTPRPDPSDGDSPEQLPPGSPLLAPSALRPDCCHAESPARNCRSYRHLTYTLRQSMDRLTMSWPPCCLYKPPQPASPAPSAIIELFTFPQRQSQSLSLVLVTRRMKMAPRDYRSAAAASVLPTAPKQEEEIFLLDLT